MVAGTKQVLSLKAAELVRGRSHLRSDKLRIQTERIRRSTRILKEIEADPEGQQEQKLSQEESTKAKL